MSRRIFQQGMDLTEGFRNRVNYRKTLRQRRRQNLLRNRRTFVPTGERNTDWNGNFGGVDPSDFIPLPESNEDVDPLPLPDPLIRLREQREAQERYQRALEADRARLLERQRLQAIELAKQREQERLIEEERLRQLAVEEAEYRAQILARRARERAQLQAYELRVRQQQEAYNREQERLQREREELMNLPLQSLPEEESPSPELEEGLQALPEEESPSPQIDALPLPSGIVQPRPEPVITPPQTESEPSEMEQELLDLTDEEEDIEPLPVSQADERRERLRKQHEDEIEHKRQQVREMIESESSDEVVWDHVDEEKVNKQNKRMIDFENGVRVGWDDAFDSQPEIGEKEKAEARKRRLFLAGDDQKDLLDAAEGVEVTFDTPAEGEEESEAVELKYDQLPNSVVPKLAEIGVSTLPGKDRRNIVRVLTQLFYKQKPSRKSLKKAITALQRIGALGNVFKFGQFYAHLSPTPKPTIDFVSIVDINNIPNPPDNMMDMDPEIIDNLIGDQITKWNTRFQGEEIPSEPIARTDPNFIEKVVQGTENQRYEKVNSHVDVMQAFRQITLANQSFTLDISLMSTEERDTMIRNLMTAVSSGSGTIIVSLGSVNEQGRTNWNVFTMATDNLHKLHAALSSTSVDIENIDSFKERINEISMVNYINIRKANVTVNRQSRSGGFLYVMHLLKLDLKEALMFSEFQVKNGLTDFESDCFIHSVTRQFERSKRHEIAAKIIHLSTENTPMAKLRLIAEAIEVYIKVKIFRKGKPTMKKYFGNRDHPVILLSWFLNHWIDGTIKVNCTSYAIKHYPEVCDLPDWNTITRKRRNSYDRSINFKKTSINRVLKFLNTTNGYFKPIPLEYLSDTSSNIIKPLRVLFPGIKAEHWEDVLEEKNGTYYCKPPTYPFMLHKEQKEYHIIVADFEAEAINKHKPLCISWQEIEDMESQQLGEIHHIVGSDCAKVFLKDIPNYSIVIFHNLTYDIQFLLEHFFFTSELKFIMKGKRFVGGTTAIKSVEGKYVSFRDSYRWFNTKLSNLPAMFLDGSIEKEIMPYRHYKTDMIYKKWSDIQEAEKYLPIKDRYQFTQNLRRLKLINPLNINQFDHMEYLKYYCNRDVEVLSQSITVFNKVLIELGKELNIKHEISLLNFYSISSIAKYLMKATGCFDGVMESCGLMRDWLSQAVRGGRTQTMCNRVLRFDQTGVYVRTGKNKSKDFSEEEFENLQKRSERENKDLDEYQLRPKYLKPYEQRFSTENEFIYVDATSLYPSAFVSMPGFPIGIPEVYTPSHKYGIIEVLVTKVPNPRGIGIHGYYRDGKLIWNDKLLEGKRIVIDTITLRELRTYTGIEIHTSSIIGVGWNNFNEQSKKLTNLLFQKRLEYKRQKNGPMQNLLKLCLNSMYGKLIQKAPEDKIRFFNSGKEAIEYALRHSSQIRSITQLTSGPLDQNAAHYVKRYVHNKLYANLPHCGTMVLSQSKRLMNRVIFALINNKFPVLYTDTDSVLTSINGYEFIKDYFRDIKNPCFQSKLGTVDGDGDLILEGLINALDEEDDPSKYGIEGKALGQFHGDFDVPFNADPNTARATKGYILGKKVNCYKVEYDTLEGKGRNLHVRMKGISKASIERKIKISKRNEMQIFKNLYAGNMEEFNLLAGAPRFEHTENFCYQNKKRFVRSVKF